jgi:hypothetical protein
MGKFRTIINAFRRLSPQQKAIVEKEVEDSGKALNKLNMKEVDEVSAPIPPKNPEPTPEGVNRVDISEETKANIEAITRTQGNRELQENAMDKALARSTKEIQPAEPAHTITYEDLEH